MYWFSFSVIVIVNADPVILNPFYLELFFFSHTNWNNEANFIVSESGKYAAHILPG